MPVDPIGIGAMSLPPTPTANGALLTTPAGTAALRLYLETGASVTYTVAHDQPPVPPTALFTIAATAPVTHDEPLARGQQVYVTAVTGSVLYRAL
jgi:hypothetical protein